MRANDFFCGHNASLVLKFCAQRCSFIYIYMFVNPSGQVRSRPNPQYTAVIVARRAGIWTPANSSSRKYIMRTVLVRGDPRYQVKTNHNIIYMYIQAAQ